MIAGCHAVTMKSRAAVQPDANPGAVLTSFLSPVLHSWFWVDGGSLFLRMRNAVDGHFLSAMRAHPERAGTDPSVPWQAG